MRLIAFVLVTSGCANRQEVPLKGEVYTSALGNFSCRVLALVQPGARLQQRSDGDSAEVMFSDDIGSLLRIESERWPADMMSLLDADRQSATLDRLLDKTIFPDLFLKVSPKSSVLHREHVTTRTAPALFIVVKVPGGSTLRDADGSRLDSIRGVFVFFKQGFLHVISNQERPVKGDVWQPTLEGRSIRLLDAIQDCVIGMTFHTNAS